MDSFSEQQYDILNHINKGENVVVNAVAGSG